MCTTPKVSLVRYSTSLQVPDQVIVFPSDLLLCIQGNCLYGRFELSYQPIYYKDEDRVTLLPWPCTISAPLYMACSYDHDLYIKTTKSMLENPETNKIWLEDFHGYLQFLNEDEYMVVKSFIFYLSHYLGITEEESIKLINKHKVKLCKMSRDCASFYFAEKGFVQYCEMF
jgi:hypothetical protein